MLHAHLIVDARLWLLIYFNLYFFSKCLRLQCIIKIGPFDSDDSTLAQLVNFMLFNENLRALDMMAKSACEWHRHNRQLNFNFPSSNAWLCNCCYARLCRSEVWCLNALTTMLAALVFNELPFGAGFPEQFTLAHHTWLQSIKFKLCPIVAQLRPSEQL